MADDKDKDALLGEAAPKHRTPRAAADDPRAADDKDDNRQALHGRGLVVGGEEDVEGVMPGLGAVLHAALDGRRREVEVKGAEEGGREQQAVEHNTHGSEDPLEPEVEGEDDDEEEAHENDDFSAAARR